MAENVLCRDGQAGRATVLRGDGPGSNVEQFEEGPTVHAPILAIRRGNLVAGLQGGVVGCLGGTRRGRSGSGFTMTAECKR